MFKKVIRELRALLPWRARRWRKSVKRANRVNHRAFPAQLGALRLLRAGAISHPEEPVIVAAMRNEARALPDFFSHYRKLKVRNFVFVDNESTDESVKLCEAQDDLNITIYSTSQVYRESRSGLEWTNAIIDFLSRKDDYWILFVDLDEHLVYPGFEEISLRKLAWFMRKHGHDALFTPMVDMYPDADIHSPEYDNSFAGSRYYDARGYAFGKAARFPLFQLTGGARRRYLEDTRISLKKVAFFNTSSNALPEISSHAYTARMELAPVTGALLHYKFAASFVEKVSSEVIEKRRTQAQDYELYNKQLSRACNLYDAAISHEFTGSLSLMEDSIMWASTGFINHFGKQLPAELAERISGLSENYSERTLDQLFDIMPVISSSSARY